MKDTHNFFSPHIVKDAKLDKEYKKDYRKYKRMLKNEI